MGRVSAENGFRVRAQPSQAGEHRFKACEGCSDCHRKDQRQFRRRWRPTEHGEAPPALGPVHKQRTQVRRDFLHRLRKHLQRGPEYSVHRHAEQATLLALSLRCSDRGTKIRIGTGQPLTMDMSSLDCPESRDQKETQRCQGAHPLGLRRGNTSALAYGRQGQLGRESLGNETLCLV